MQPDGSLTRVELQDGQFAVVAKDWGRDGQVEVTQYLTWGGDASGYLECANESDEAPCGWPVASDVVGLLPYAGQKGYVAAWLDGDAVGRRHITSQVSTQVLKCGIWRLSEKSVS